MNKQELKQLLKDSEVKGLKIFDNEVYGIPSSTVLGLIDQLDEKSPICLKDIIKRIKGLDVGTRTLWIDKILEELGSDYGSTKYRAGFEQGKFDSMIEREKVTIPDFVENYIKDAKFWYWDIQDAMKYMDDEECTELLKWFYEEKNMETFARAWLDGYEIEREHRYIIKFKGLDSDNRVLKKKKGWYFGGDWENEEAKLKNHTRKELEKAGFGWVFDCEGIEVEEAE
jgi:phage protein